MSASEEVAALGGTQRFECQVVGYPSPIVTWFKDEVDITQDPRYNIHFDQVRGVIALTIREVLPTDEGCYQCRAQNSEGYATTTAYLVVRVDHGLSRGFRSMLVSEKISEQESSQMQMASANKQRVIEEVITRYEESEKEVIEEKLFPPKLTYDCALSDGVQLKAGSTLYIEVGVSGIPFPSVAWKHGDTLLKEDARITMEDDPSGYSYLKVKGTTREDEGTYKVMAENTVGKDEASFNIVIRGTPTAPRNLHIQEVYKDYIVIRWEAPEQDGGFPITSYNIEKSLSGGTFLSVNQVLPSEHEFKVTRLYEGSEYMFRVSAENKAGVGAFATTDKPTKARLPFDPPGKPRDLMVTSVDKDSVGLSWEAPESDGGALITSFIVERKDVMRASSMWAIAATVDGTTRSLMVGKLFTGNCYHFRVFAENRVGPGEPATLDDGVIAKLPYDSPGPARNIRAVETNVDYIVLEWDPPESDGGSPLTSYIVEKRDARRKEFIYIADIGPECTQFKATRLFEGYEYYFRVFAENIVGPSEPCEMEKPVRAKLPYDEPYPPHSLRVTDYWTDFITIEWEGPENDGGSPLTGYVIEKRDALRQSWIKAGNVGPDVNNFKVTNLFEGTDYVLRVFAENKVGPSLTAAELEKPQRAKMPYDAPMAPQSLTTSDVTSESVTVSWTAPANDGGAEITRYAIEKRDAMRMTWGVCGYTEPGVNTFTVEGLIAGDNYFFRVAAENKVGRGDYVELIHPITAKMPYDKPGPPSNLRTTDVWKNYITIAWEAPEYDGGAPILGYHIEIRDTMKAEFRDVGKTAANVTEFQVGCLEEGRDYYFRVFACNKAGVGENPSSLKPAVKAQLPYDRPSAPTALTVVGTGKGTISITWGLPDNEGGSPVTGYTIEACHAREPDNYKPVGTVEATILDYTITDLIDGGDYFVRVRAENAAGLSDEAAQTDLPVCAREPKTAPEAPGALTVTSVTSESVTVTWSAPASDGGSKVTSYTVEVREVGMTFTPAVEVDGSTLTATLPGLTPEKAYEIQVFAKNSEGLSSPVMLAEPFKTEPAPVTMTPPSAPRGLRVTEVRSDAITVTWEAPGSDGGSPVARYVVVIKDAASTKKFRKAGRVDANTMTLTVTDKIKPGHEYNMVVYGENEAGVSDDGAELATPVMVPEPQPVVEPQAVVEELVEMVESAPVEAAKPKAVPGTPGNARCEAVTSEGFTLTWDAPADSGGSIITKYTIVMRDVEKKKFKSVGEVDGTTTSFLVDKVKSEHEYVLRVYAENEVGLSAESEISEPIKVPAKKSEDTVDAKGPAPEIVTAPEPVAIAEGETIRLTCKVKGDPDPDVEWYKDGKAIKIKRSNKRVRINWDMDTDIYTLEVDKAMESDAGEYMIKAINSKGTQEFKVEVDVGETLKRKRVRQEMSVSETIEVKETAVTEEAKITQKVEEEAAVTIEAAVKPIPAEPEPVVEEVMPDVVTEVQSPVPKTESPTPVTEAPVPKPESPTPKAESPAPEAEALAPKAESPVPKAESPAPKAKSPVPKAESPAPEIEKLVPKAESPAPKAESPAPEAIELKEPEVPVTKDSEDSELKEPEKPKPSTPEPEAELISQIVIDEVEPEIAEVIEAAVTEKGVTPEIAERVDTEAVLTMDMELSEVVQTTKTELVSEVITKAESEERVEVVVEAKEQTPATTETEVSMTLEAEETVISSQTTITESEMATVIQKDVTQITSVEESLSEKEEELKVVGVLKDVTQIAGGLQIVSISGSEPSSDESSSEEEEGAAPKFITKPEATVVDFGEEIRLTCQVSGDPEPEVTWYKGDKRLKASKREPRLKIHWDMAQDLNVLVIMDAGAEDSGQYTVVAENEHGTFRFTVTVLVGKPAGAEIIKTIESKRTVTTVEETVVDGEVVERTVKSETSEDTPEVTVERSEVSESTLPVAVAQEEGAAPKFEQPPEPMLVDFGEEIRLTCRVTGDPEPEVTWYKEGEEIKSKKGEQRVKVDWDMKQDLNILTIKDATKEDAGKYTVIADNKFGSFKFSVTVLVGKPEGGGEIIKTTESKRAVTVVEETIVDGEVVERTVKEDVSETEPMTVVERITVAEAVTPAESEPEGRPPKFVQPPEPVFVDFGETVKLTCKVEGDPEPTVTWCRMDDELLSTSDLRIQVEQIGDTYTLTIKDATEEDAGDYKVKAANKYGTFNFTVTVLVGHPAGAHIVETTRTTKSVHETVVDGEVVEHEEKEDVQVEKFDQVDSHATVKVESSEMATLKQEVIEEAVTKEVIEEVEVPRPADDKSPKFDVPPKPVSVEEGETIRLTCKVSGAPEPEVCWYKGDAQIKPSKRDTRIQTTWSMADDLNHLVVTTARLSDAGEYTVRAHNSHGQQSVTVSVMVGTLLVVEKQETVEDTSEMLIQEERSTSEERTVTVDVTIEEEESTSSQGVATEGVTETTEEEQAETEVSVPVIEDAEEDVSVDIAVEPTVAEVSQTFTETDALQTESTSTEVSTTMELAEGKEHDAAAVVTETVTEVFTHLATQKAAEVPGAPKIDLEPKPVIVDVGEMIEISCRFSGDPEPEVMFFKGEMRIKNKKTNKRVHVDWDMKTDLYTLTIQEATPADAGDYIICAENSHGEIRYTVSVVVGHEVVETTSSVTSTEQTVVSGGVEHTIVHEETLTQSSSAAVTKSVSTVKETSVMDICDSSTEEAVEVSKSAVSETLEISDDAAKDVVEGIIETAETSITETIVVSNDIVADEPKEDVDEFKSVTAATTETVLVESVDTIEDTEMERVSDKASSVDSSEDSSSESESESEGESVSDGGDVGAPTIEQAPEPVNVKLGETIYLKCKVTGDPEPDVIWLRDDIEIKPRRLDKRVKIDWDMNQNLYVLTIKDATLNDAGEYAVKASNVNGGFTLKVTVVVRDGSESIADTVTTKTSTSQVETIDETGNATMVVQTETTSISTVTNGTEIATNQSASESISESVLESPLSEEISVGVAGAPVMELAPEPAVVKVGGTIHLTCSVKGDPAPTIEWYIGDERVVASSRVALQYDMSTCLHSLTIVTATEADAGAYTMKGSNVHGWVRVTVLVSMDESSNDVETGITEEDTAVTKMLETEILITDVVTTASEHNISKILTEVGDSTKLEQAELSPETEPSIVDDRNILKTADDPEIISTVNKTELLQTQLIEHSEVTEIPCEMVKKELGQAELKVESPGLDIEVKEVTETIAGIIEGSAGSTSEESESEVGSAPKFIIHPEPQVVEIGETMKLTCKVIADPEPDVTWYKDEKAIIPRKWETRIKVSWDINDNYTLSIQNMTDTDSGEYKVMALNTHGTASYTVMVHVGKEKPSASMETSTRKVEVMVSSSETSFILTEDVSEVTHIKAKTIELSADENIEVTQVIKQESMREVPEDINTIEETCIQQDIVAASKDIIYETLESSTDVAMESTQVAENDVNKELDEQNLDTKSAEIEQTTQVMESDTHREEVEITTEAIVSEVTSTPSEEVVAVENKLESGEDNSTVETVDLTKTPLEVVNEETGEEELNQKSAGMTFQLEEVTEVVTSFSTVTIAGSEGSTSEESESDSEEGSAPEFLVHPEPQFIAVGDVINLTCKVIADPEPAVTWYKDEKEIRPRKWDTRIKVSWDINDNYALSIQKTADSDSGAYKVMAENIHGTVSCTVRVHVGKAPVSMVEEKKTTITETSIMTKGAEECSSEMIVTETVVTETEVVSEGTDIKTEITEISTEVNTEVMKVVEQESEKEHPETEIGVPEDISKDEEICMKTEIAAETKDITTKTLEISAPAVQNEVEQEMDETNLKIEVPRIEQEVDEIGTQLEKSESEAETIVGEDRLTQKSCNASILKEEGPSADSKLASKEAGQTAEKSEIIDVPSEEFNTETIEEERKQQLAHMDFQLEKVTEAVTGFRTDTIEGSESSASEESDSESEDGNAPKFMVQPEPQMVAVGETINLSCKVSAEPEPDVTWYKDDKAIRPRKWDTRIKVNWDINDNYTLSIKKVTSSDSGMYKVIASNAHGTSCCTVIVHVCEVSALKVQATSSATSDTSITNTAEACSLAMIDTKTEVVSESIYTTYDTIAGPTEDNTEMPQVAGKESNKEILQSEVVVSDDEKAGIKDVIVAENIDITSETSEITQESEGSHTKYENDIKTDVESVHKFEEQFRMINMVPIAEKTDATNTPTEDPTGTEEKPTVGSDNSCEVNANTAEPIKEETVDKEAMDNCGIEGLGCALPSFLQHPEPVTVDVGETFKLTCKVDGDPDPDVSWFKDGKLIKPPKWDKRVQLKWDIATDTYSVTITDSTTADSGEYKVDASNRLGTESFTVSVLVGKQTSKTDVVATASKMESFPVTSPEQHSESQLSEVSMTVAEEGTSKIGTSRTGATGTEKIVEKKNSDFSACGGDASLAISTKLEEEEDGHDDIVRVSSGWMKASDKALKSNHPKAPKFVEVPLPVKVKFGDTLRIACKVEADPTPKELFWFKGNEPIMPKKWDRRIRFMKTDSYIMTISKVTLDDAGEYTVQFDNYHGACSHTIMATVVQDTPTHSEIKPDPISSEMTGPQEKSAPEFTVPPQPTVVEEDKAIRLSCNVTGLPETQVTWYHGDVAIQPKKWDRRVRVMNQDGKHILNIMKCTKADAGEYRVKAENELGTVTNRAMVYVGNYTVSEILELTTTEWSIAQAELRAALKQAGSEDIQKEKDTAVTSDAKTNVQEVMETAKDADIDKSKEEVQVTVQREVEEVKPIEPKHEEMKSSGTATLIEKVVVDNKSPEAKLSKQSDSIASSDSPPEGAPIFANYPKPVIVDIGETVLLSCKVLADPDPDIDWYKADTLIKLKKWDTRTKIKWDLDDNYMLSIEKATEQDSGEYKVKASNVHGVSSYSVTVLVGKQLETITQETRLTTTGVMAVDQTTSVTSAESLEPMTTITSNDTSARKQQFEDQKELEITKEEVESSEATTHFDTTDDQKEMIEGKVDFQCEEINEAATDLKSVTPDESDSSSESYSEFLAAIATAEKTQIGKNEGEISTNIVTSSTVVVEKTRSSTEVVVETTSEQNIEKIKSQEIVKDSSSKMFIEERIVKKSCDAISDKVIEESKSQPETVVETRSHEIAEITKSPDVKEVSRSKSDETDEKTMEFQLEDVTQVVTDFKALTIDYSESESESESDGQGPIISKPPQSLSIDLGGTILLTCVVFADPEPDVTWYKDGTAIRPKKWDQRVKVSWSVSDNIYSLTIIRSRQKDSGLYKVLASNPHGTASVTVAVSVGSKARVDKTMAKVSEERLEEVKTTKKSQGRKEESEVTEMMMTSTEEVIKAETVGETKAPLPKSQAQTRSSDTDVKYNKVSHIEQTCVKTDEEASESFSETGQHSADVIQEDIDKVFSRTDVLFSEDKLTSTHPKSPRFVELPQSLDVKLGDTIRISCKVEADPTPKELFWFKGNEPILPKKWDHRIRFMKTDNFVMIIGKATLDDAGEYTVQFDNYHGVCSHTIKVTVEKVSETTETTETVPPSSEVTDIQQESAPKFLVPPQPTVIEEHKAIRLSCKISGFPEPEVTWYRGDTAIQPKKWDRHVRVMTQEGKHILNIMKCSKADAGEYRVTARNELGTATYTVTVYIGNYTTSQILELTTTEFSIAEAQLHAAESEAAKKTMAEEIKETVDNIVTDDVKTPVTEITTVIEERTQIGKEDSDCQKQEVAKITEGSESKDIDVLALSAEDIVTEDIEAQVDVSEKIGGNIAFQLEEINEAVTDFKSVTLAETDSSSETESESEEGELPKFVTPPKSVVVDIGETIVLECEVFSDPEPDVTWYKNDVAVRPKKWDTRIKVRWGITDDKHSLTIKDATENDSGQYKVSASNMCGVISLTVNVTVGKAETMQPKTVAPSDVSPVSTAVIAEPSSIKELVVTKSEVVEEEAESKEIIIDNCLQQVVEETSIKEALSETVETIIEETMTSDTDVEKTSLHIVEETKSKETVIENTATEFTDVAKSQESVVETGNIEVNEEHKNKQIEETKMEFKLEEMTESVTSFQTVSIEESDSESEQEGDLPTISELPDKLCVDVGETISLRCVVLSEPEADVTWYKDGTAVTPKKRDKRVKVSWGISDDSYSLTIIGATYDDAGLYKVTASNTSGTASVTLRLTVGKQVEDVLTVLSAEKVKGDQTILKSVKDQEDDEKNKKTVTFSEEIVEFSPPITVDEKKNKLEEIAESVVESDFETNAVKGKKTETLVEQSKESVSEQYTEDDIVRVSSGFDRTVSESKLHSTHPKAPKFVELPQPVTVRFGETIRIACKVYADPTPKELFWFKGDEPILPKKWDRRIRFMKTDSFIMNIAKATLDDAGEYTMQFDNYHGACSHTINVTVEKVSEKTETTEPTTSASETIISQEKAPPKFVILPEPTVVEEDKAIRLACKISGTPEPQVVWYHGDTPIQPKKWDRRMRVMTQDGKHILNIMKCTKADAGEYNVKAHNELGSVASSATVYVGNYTPSEIFKLTEVTWDRMEAAAETSNKLTTSSTDIDYTNTGLSEIGDELVAIDKLKILENVSVVSEVTAGIVESKSDVSVCVRKPEICESESKHDIGEPVTELALCPDASVTSPGAPAMDICPAPVVVAPGETITLRCKVSGDPEPDVTWHKDGKQIKTRLRDKRIRVDWDMKTDEQFLEIHDATKADAGDYELRAENDKGSTSFTVSVNVGDTDSAAVYERHVVTSSSSSSSSMTSSSLLDDPMFSDMGGSMRFSSHFK